MDTIRVFYSYAHGDERLRKKLETHLGLLQQQGLIASWHDRNISAGTEWAQEISDNLNTAQIILLLVSASFLASQYCYSREMMRALERHEDGNARVIPIILRPVYWENAPFSKLQVLPKDAKPITKWANQDEAFLDVVKGIRDAIEALGRKETGPEAHFMLLTDLSIEIGPAIAKSILKLWFKDFNIAVDVASSVLDMLKSKTIDRVAQKRGQRQFEAIGEKVAESLLPIFEAHSDLSKGRYTAVALTVADTLNTIPGEAIAHLNLDPSHLAKYLLNKHPATNYHFNETETLVYQRIISESCAYIVDIASQLPTFHKDTFVEILKQEGQILSIANEILEEVGRIRKHLNPEEKDAQEAAHFELEYRRAVLRNLDTLQLFGTNVATSSRRHRLSMAYIMLSVKQKTWETSQQESVRTMTIHGRSEDENSY